MDPAVQLVIQILLAVVVAAVGFIVKGLAGDIKDFTRNLEQVGREISSLRVEMVKDFALKDDLIPIRNRIAELLSREEMTMLRTKVEKISTDVSTLMAASELHRRKGEH